MAIHILKQGQLAKLTHRGMYRDGGGLFLQVSRGSKNQINRSWIFRYAVGGRERWMGLGSLNTITLAEARDMALALRKQRLQGIDPLDARRAEQAAAKAAAALSVAKAGAPTFDEAADAYAQAQAAGWRSPKHGQDWLVSIRRYVSPVLGKVPVSAVDTPLVLKVLEPIWSTKSETASRLRGRIEAVLDWAKVRGHRTGDNPARWRGHLDKLLPSKGKVRKANGGAQHMESLPYSDAPAFWVRAQAEDRIGFKAMRFIILTAVRAGEALQARWAEIDLSTKVWTIPAERMKSHREHRVALSDAAVALLQALPKSSEYVFPGERAVTVSDHLLIKHLRAMGLTCTTHGFRSTFRTWAAERTSFPREVIEAALAHAVGDATERAYQRGDMFEKRSKLMNAWATYLNTPATGSVVPLKVVV
jgi:integrase